MKSSLYLYIRYSTIQLSTRQVKRERMKERYTGANLSEGTSVRHVAFDTIRGGSAQLKTKGNEKSE
jgi:hypothetical protein